MSIFDSFDESPPEDSVHDSCESWMVTSSSDLLFCDYLGCTPIDLLQEVPVVHHDEDDDFRMDVLESMELNLSQSAQELQSSPESPAPPDLLSTQLSSQHETASSEILKEFPVIKRPEDKVIIGRKMSVRKSETRFSRGAELTPVQKTRQKAKLFWQLTEEALMASIRIVDYFKSETSGEYIEPFEPYCPIPVPQEFQHRNTGKRVNGKRGKAKRDDIRQKRKRTADLDSSLRYGSRKKLQQMNASLQLLHNMSCIRRAKEMDRLQPDLEKRIMDNLIPLFQDVEQRVSRMFELKYIPRNFKHVAEALMAPLNNYRGGKMMSS